MIFSDGERAYLQRARLGRIATVNRQGKPRVSPVGFRLNEELDVIESGGRDAAGTRRWQDLQRNPNVAFVVDDLTSTDPWRPRGVQIRGVAELVEDETEADRMYRAYIRIHPQTVHAWGLEGDPYAGKTRVVGADATASRAAPD